MKSTIIEGIRRYLKSPYYGFLQGHDYLSQEQLITLEQMVELEDQSVVREFESQFTKLIGDGRSVSFAAGRMGFYALMKILKVGKGDEVVLQGHTCSVMPNAVWRSGAKPVFADIDPDTFGSSAVEIDKVITQKTKMIVAQHSFGIPCNIEPIVELAKSKGIFLLEDCAISLESKIKDTKIGNFGDASLFSMDHSKPINAFIGGLIYTRNVELYKSLSKAQEASENLSQDKQSAIWNKFLFERKYCNPVNYGKSFLVDKINRHLFRERNAYLTNDYTKASSPAYPYPARLPGFLAQLGLFELERWDDNKKERQELLKIFIKMSTSLGLSDYLPPPYFEQDIEIIPLRFVYTHPDAENIRKKISKSIDISWFWFDQPIIACNDPRDLGYIAGSCPVSEQTGKEIINWPCVFGEKFYQDMFDIFNVSHIA